MNQAKSSTNHLWRDANAPHFHAKTASAPASAPAARHVMACLDRSRLSEGCLPYAVFMAQALGAELTLLHVIPSPSEADPSAFDLLGWEISRREAAQYLSRMQAEIDERGIAVGIRTELAQGHPAERLLSLARALEADLTVLSRRGEGGSAGWTLGATAQRVLMNAPGSVLIVPSEGPAPTIPPKRILVPLDGSARAESVLPLVLEATTAQQAEVVLLHVVTDPRPTGVLSDSKDLLLARTLATRLQAGGETYLVGVRERLLRLVPRVKVRILRCADTREALLQAALDEKADLIVLSAHGETCNADHPFGSMTAHALSHATLPLLVVQDLPVPDRWHADRLGTSDGVVEGVGRTSLSNRPVAH
jgi:nucleotide-binding universal stress UspA family protein